MEKTSSIIFELSEKIKLNISLCKLFTYNMYLYIKMLVEAIFYIILYIINKMKPFHSIFILLRLMQTSIQI